MNTLHCIVETRALKIKGKDHFISGGGTKIELKDGKLSVIDALRSSTIFEPVRLTKIKASFNQSSKLWQITSDGLYLSFLGNQDFKSRILPALLPEEKPLRNVPLNVNNRPKYTQTGARRIVFPFFFLLTHLHEEFVSLN